MIQLKIPKHDCFDHLKLEFEIRACHQAGIWGLESEILDFQPYALCALRFATF